MKSNSKVKAQINKIRSNFINKLNKNEISKNAYIIFTKPYVSSLPGEISFFTLWAIIPFFVALNYFSLLFHIPIEFDNSATAISDTASNILGSLPKINTSRVVFFSLTIVYLSSKSFVSIIRATDLIYLSKKKPHFLITRIRSIFYLILTLVLIFSILILNVLSQSIINFITTSLELPFKGLLLTISSLVSIVLIFVFMTFIYTYLPQKKLKFKDSLYGALFTTITWFLTSFGLSFYVTYLSSAAQIYGVFSNLLIVFIWIYAFSYIFIFGLIINAAIYYKKNNIEIIE